MSDSPTTVFSSDESPKIGFVTRVYVWLMQPKIGIPLAIFVMCLAGPFIYRAMRLFQIPEPPMPFDVAAFKADIVPEEKNGARLLAEIDKRSPPFPPMENRTGHNEALENGRWEAASPKLQEWVLDHRDALDKWRELAHMPDMQVYKP